MGICDSRNVVSIKLGNKGTITMVEEYSIRDDGPLVIKNKEDLEIARYQYNMPIISIDLHRNDVEVPDKTLDNLKGCRIDMDKSLYWRILKPYRPCPNCSSWSYTAKWEGLAYRQVEPVYYECEMCEYRRMMGYYGQPMDIDDYEDYDIEILKY